MHASGLGRRRHPPGRHDRPRAVAGRRRRVGSIDVGKWADLIAMPEDPLSDPSALRGIDLVMQDGIVVRDGRSS